MRALLTIWPRNGHFPDCPHRDHSHHGCSRCKRSFYLFALFSTVLISGLEFWGYGRTSSESLFADAWHMVSDSFGYVIGAVVTTMALRGLFDDDDVLKRRMERVTALFVYLAGLYMFANSLTSIVSGKPPQLTGNHLLLEIAFAGLVLNVLLAYLMKDLRVEHEHSHPHHHEDVLLESNLLHTIGDALSSFFVVVDGVLALYFDGPWVGYFDLTVSATIAGWLMYQAWQILRPPR